MSEEKLVDTHTAEAVDPIMEATAYHDAKPEKTNQPQELAKTEELRPAKIVDGELVLTENQKMMIRKQFAPEASDEEFNLFVMMAYRMRLDPLLKQIYFIKYGNNVSYVTSIDSYRIIAHRTGDFAGVDNPVYKRDTTGKVTHASITVYKFVRGEKCGFSAEVKFSEYNTGKNQWASKPETMIAKVAEAHALRKAFPNDLAGVYTSDEMDTLKEDKAKEEALKAKAEADRKAKEEAEKVAEEKKESLQYLSELLPTKGKTEDELIAALRTKNPKMKDISSLTFEQIQQLIQKVEAMPDFIEETINLDEIPFS